LTPVWQLGQRIAHRNYVGMLLSREASYPLASLVHDAADAERHQRYTEEIQK
jgi:hypothetical protein